MIWLFAAAAVTASSPSPATGFCPRAAEVIEDELKNVAYLRTQDILDDSAPRATMRAAQGQVSLAAIQANLTMMLAAHCALPAHPIVPSYYANSATECVLAKGDAVKAACDRSTWVPLKP